MEHFIDAFRNFANFSGRASRTQYWMFFLVYFIALIVLTVLDVVVGTMVISTLFSLAVLIPSISIAARRLHDTGKSGWWQLVALIPLIGWIILIVMLAQPSQGENAYGAQPATA
ncbi:DUF805 domain-containing protein [Marinobacter nanhaiticus D15-8W]|uniref:DUF805 domain-containing protein n=1 Tax=Marinobacter nanhaiticus D15-8W TaxID=626887 RepID=N6VX19_9GAMM|nr:DUF805 domain-containing protein [Marinobacter nanhaiticus]ENO14775.1 DUF805 domain-containing protein [Marinobacter nanhaiticus D15-8W]BES69536.1 DUF805 domain-containing protein [Marinobacter nanhaiticus D15-8W]